MSVALGNPFVLKLSGHLFDELGGLGRYVDAIRGLWRDGHRLAVVTGGGSLARRYVEAGRGLGVNEGLLDLLGIMASRLNAQLLASALGDVAYLSVPANLEEAFKAWASGRLVVVGGFQPGQSTATVAMLVAEFLGARAVVDCANVDAVYTGDPRRDPSARRLDRVGVDELMGMLRARTLAGTYDLLDPWALSIAKRSGVTIYVANCGSPDALRRLAETGAGAGTVITPQGGQ